jgi:hypothetical protein
VNGEGRRAHEERTGRPHTSEVHGRRARVELVGAQWSVYYAALGRGFSVREAFERARVVSPVWPEAA